MDDPTNPREDRVVARTLCAVTGVLLPVALGLLGGVLVLRSSTSDFDTHRYTLGAGLVVTLWLAFVAMGVSQMLRSSLDDRRGI